MELAKLTSKGQITIPLAIRNMLGLKTGDKVYFGQELNFPDGATRPNE